MCLNITNIINVKIHNKNLRIWKERNKVTYYRNHITTSVHHYPP